MTEFLHMGGYALYVWSSYGLALVVLVWNLVQPVRTQRKIAARIRKQVAQRVQDE